MYLRTALNGDIVLKKGQFPYPLIAWILRRFHRVLPNHWRLESCRVEMNIWDYAIFTTKQAERDQYGRII